jgi:DNA replication and repair protein RecF
MKIDSLTLRSFRNIRESTLTPGPRLNFLLGKNGQGKTSFLEAIGYLSSLRSFRGSKTNEVIRWGDPQAEVECEIGGAAGWQTRLKIVFEKSVIDPEKASKVAFINGKPYKNSAAFLSQRFGQFELGFHSVIFNPSDHDLVRGEPAIRRAYIDRALAAEDIKYLKALQKYQRLLQQRNALLKSFGDARPPSFRDLLLGFTEPMAEYAAYLGLRRLEWLQRVGFRLTDLMRKIIPSEVELRAVYLSNWAPKIEGLSLENDDLNPVHFAGHGHLPSLELLEQAFWKRLSVVEPAELRSGHSLVGPHRDDWTFYLGNQVLKGHGSQGEVRSALLALKLAEIELFQNSTGHQPVFLLDDFSSELDRERRSFLLDFLSDSNLQVFVTTTEDSIAAGQQVWVVQGALQPSSPTDSRKKPELRPGDTDSESPI